MTCWIKTILPNLKTNPPSGVRLLINQWYICKRNEGDEAKTFTNIEKLGEQSTHVDGKISHLKGGSASTIGMCPWLLNKIIH